MLTTQDLLNVGLSRHDDGVTVFYRHKRTDIVGVRFTHGPGNAEVVLYETGEVLDASSGQATHNTNRKLATYGATWFEYYALRGNQREYLKRNEGRHF